MRCAGSALRHQYRVDEVHGGVAGLDVAADDACVVGGVVSPDFAVLIVPPCSVVRVPGVQVGRRLALLDDVVREDVGQRLLVGEDLARVSAGSWRTLRWSARTRVMSWALFSVSTRPAFVTAATSVDKCGVLGGGRGDRLVGDGREASRAAGRYAGAGGSERAAGRRRSGAGRGRGGVPARCRLRWRCCCTRPGRACRVRAVAVKIRRVRACGEMSWRVLFLLGFVEWRTRATGALFRTPSRAGRRASWSPTPQDGAKLRGDVHRGQADQAVDDPGQRVGLAELESGDAATRSNRAMATRPQFSPRR